MVEKANMSVVTRRSKGVVCGRAHREQQWKISGGMPKDSLYNLLFKSDFSLIFRISKEEGKLAVSLALSTPMDVA